MSVEGIYYNGRLIFIKLLIMSGRENMHPLS